MDILITGGTGLLGHHLVPALQERGETVRVLALPGENTRWLEERDVKVYRGDILQPQTLTAPVSGTGAVLHCAAMMGVWRPMEAYHAVNMTGTENVCRAALAEGVGRVVHISSWSCYGMDRGEIMHEDSPLKPFAEPYAITKTAADVAVRRMIAEEQLPAVIIRPGTFFGPDDQLHFGRMADRLRAGKGVIVGSGDNALPLVYVTDVVQGLLLALSHPDAVGQVYNISHDAPLTQRQFLEEIARVIGAKPPRVHLPYRPLYTAGYLAERLAEATSNRVHPVVTRLGVKLFGTDNRHSVDKARHELGYRPEVGLREGVRLAASWYLAQERPHAPSEPAAA
jgi:nucleoside-diphosphate-sugar epimerase